MTGPSLPQPAPSAKAGIGQGEASGSSASDPLSLFLLCPVGQFSSSEMSEGEGDPTESMGWVFLSGLWLVYVFCSCCDKTP